MRVLIVKTSSFGDVVQTFPVVEYLKSRGVDHIGWVVEKDIAPLVRAHPLVDTVFEIDSRGIRNLFSWPSFFREWKRQKKILRSQEWDLLFDLQGNCKSGLVTRAIRAKKKIGYSLKSAPEPLNALFTNCRFQPPEQLAVRDEYLWFAQHYFEDNEPFLSRGIQLDLFSEQEGDLLDELIRWPEERKIWFVSPGSKWPTKRLSSEVWHQVLQLASDHWNPYFIFLAGTSYELQVVNVLAGKFPGSSHLLYKPDPAFLQRLIDKADAVISTDSFVLHLAGTTSTPTFGIFGPSKAWRYAPQGTQHSWYQGSCPYDITFSTRCSKLRVCPSPSCLKDVDSVQMFADLDMWYQNTFL